MKAYSIAEMPSHNLSYHCVNSGYVGTVSAISHMCATASQNTWGTAFSDASGWVATQRTYTINNTGSSKAHNNLQPYLCVYMFKRTA